MTSLRDESINTEGMIMSHDLIKISVGREGVTQFLILPELKGLKFELMVIEMMIVRISLKGEERVKIEVARIKRHQWKK